jgi:iron-sulfur cluster assembly protein
MTLGSPIKITDTAARHIVSLMPSPTSGLRIGLKKGGCAGMEYTMEIIEEPAPSDIECLNGDARVLIAPLAQMFLLGMEIDYQTSLLDSGFVFRNPNVASACGCGESISFEVDRSGV